MRNMKKKSFLALALTVLLLAVAVSGTVAYLVTNSGPVENTFEYGKVSCTITEDFDKTTKKNVQVKNTGNVNAYIRAAIVVTWKDSNGHTMPGQPEEGTDYTLELGKSWTKHGDYYYYNGKVAPDGSTDNLIVSCSSTKQYEDGRKLCVEVIGSAIQAEPASVSLSAWGVTPSGN